MKGYKAFNYNLTCRDFQYEIGETYHCEGELEICKNGFHFCKELKSVYSYYIFSPATRIAEVEALGEVKKEELSDKYCTNEIKIVREISLKEQLEILEIDNETYNLYCHLFYIINAFSCKGVRIIIRKNSDTNSSEIYLAFYFIDSFEEIKITKNKKEVLTQLELKTRSLDPTKEEFQLIRALIQELDIIL